MFLIQNILDNMHVAPKKRLLDILCNTNVIRDKTLLNQNRN